MRMKLYILEDEVRILKHLLQVVEGIPYVELVGHAADIAQAAREIPVLKPEIILADIRLKDGDSFRLFQELGNTDFQVIFLTAYDQYAIQALNMGAFGYLLKPIDETALADMLNKCFHHTKQEHFDRQQLEVARQHYTAPGSSGAKRIALKHVEYMEIVSVEDVMYCKSDKCYTNFFLKDKREILVSKGLIDYESTLAPHGFLRCHQSYLVNFQYVKKYYREGVLEMQNNEQVPVSSRKREEVLKYLENIS